MKEKNKDLIRSGIFGVCIGDALGLPVQFKSRSYLKKQPITEMIELNSLRILKGTWPDDSSLTLCLADSLSRGYDLRDIASNFINWYRKGFLTPDGIAFDIGVTTAASIRRLENNYSPNESGGMSIYDNGNGSLMRILPLAFFLDSKKYNSDVSYKIIKDVSSITHGHIYSLISCLIYIDMAIS
jgi:ADP-ribosylglycohydrolase